MNAAIDLDFASLPYHQGEPTNFPKRTTCACCGARPKRSFKCPTLAQYACRCGEVITIKA